MDTPLRIETERLMLRPLEAKDEQVFIGFFTDPDFMQYSRAGASNEAAARANFLRRLTRSSEKFNKLAIVEKSSAEVIGYCGVEPCELEGKHELELGYRLTSSARGRGYATEAARAVLNYYHEREVVNIISYTALGNIASQSVLKNSATKQLQTVKSTPFPSLFFIDRYQHEHFFKPHILNNLIIRPKLWSQLFKLRCT